MLGLGSPFTSSNFKFFFKNRSGERLKYRRKRVSRMPIGAGPRAVTEAGRRTVTHKATNRGVKCRLRGCLRLASLAEISAVGASRQPGAGRQQIALDERCRDASPDLRSESPIHSQRVKSGGLTTLCSRRRTWRIIWSGERRGWMEERSQFFYGRGRWRRMTPSQLQQPSLHRVQASGQS